MGRVSDDSYIQIQGWMMTRLDLKPLELIVFAIIHNFTANKQKYIGSYSYLVECLKISKPTAIKVLNDLVKKNYILEKKGNFTTPNKYTTNIKYIKKLITPSKETLLPVVKKLITPSKETLLPVVKEFDYPSKETLPNNTINNTKYNTTNNIAAAKEKLQRFLDDDFKEIVDLFSNNIHPINGEVEGNKLADYLDSYGKNWVLEAIKEAALCNGRSVNYIGKILMRWEKEGFKNGTGSEKKSAPMVRQGKTTGYKRLHSAYKAETTEEARRKFANEKSGWD
jgi:DnaD/phage-associated family protein